MIEKLYLVRHGQTDWNRELRVQGRTDTPLCEAGRQKVRSLTSALEDCGAESIITSPLSRAAETAAIIASYLKLPVEEDADLRELDCGEWEGRDFREVMDDDRENFEAWMNDSGVAAPGGESFDDVQNRIRQSLARLDERFGGRRLVLVAHAASIRAVASQLLGLPILTLTRFQLDAPSLTVLSLWSERRQYRVEHWNVRSII